MKRLYVVMCNGACGESWPTGDLPGGNTFDREDVANDHASALNRRRNAGSQRYDVMYVDYAPEGESA